VIYANSICLIFPLHKIYIFYMRAHNWNSFSTCNGMIDMFLEDSHVATSGHEVRHLGFCSSFHYL